MEQLAKDLIKAVQDTQDHVYQDIEEKEKWQLGDYIPSTYLENGIRHIVVFDEGVEQRYFMKDGKVVLDKEIF